MIGLIETDGCGLANTSQVRRIIRDGDDAVTLLGDGEKAKLPLGAEVLALSGLGVVPTAAGWYVISQCGGCGDVQREPIIAWAIASTGKATPITRGDGVVEYHHGVFAPDGSVGSYLEASHASVDEWLATRPTELQGEPASAQIETALAPPSPR